MSQACLTDLHSNVRLISTPSTGGWAKQLVGELNSPRQTLSVCLYALCTVIATSEPVMDYSSRKQQALDVNNDPLTSLAIDDRVAWRGNDVDLLPFHS
jgi:hypothetical protein